MQTVAIVQARMGSSRLPGKVLADIEGRTMLARVVLGLLDATTIDRVVIATTTLIEDEPVVAAARDLGVTIARGDRDDVLSRYLNAARSVDAEVIVRVTADCPLLDPAIVDRVVETLAPDIDYASNTHTRTFPRGLDVEAFHRDTLERLARLATTRPTREHVTSFVLEHPELFRIAQVTAEDTDAADLRWTVDTEEDLALVRALFAAGVPRDHRSLIAYVRAHPELATANAHVVQKAWTTHA
jgi:spore coat polysaccharide biosynthesis protein SpsF